jgi:hypothetical protein
MCSDLRGHQRCSRSDRGQRVTHRRDADRADEVIVAVMREMACCEIGLRPPVGAPGPVGQAQRVICKPEKDLKPQELTADMTPVEFAYWVDAFEAYHAGSHMEVATIAVHVAGVF